MWITNTLADVPAGSPAVAMIRHAERDPILDRESGWHAALTKVGTRTAFELGAVLAPLGGLRLDHSPIPRCGQTAAAMADGLRSRAVEPLVGGAIEHFSGPFIRELEEVIEHFITRGNSTFLREWFDGQLPDTAIQPAREAAMEQAMSLNAVLHADGPRLRAVVSHDWNIALVREMLLGVRHEDAGLPAFLEGVMAWREGAEMVLRFRDKTVRIQAADLPQLG